MTVGMFNRAAQQILSQLEEVIRSLLMEHGVPTGSAALYDLVALLMPHVLRSREGLYREAVMMMGRQVAQQGYQVRPAELREYTAKALYDGLARPLGLVESPGRATINVEVLDPESQQSVLETVTVDDAVSYDPANIERTAKKFTAIARRHAQDAARQAVADTSANNEVRPTPDQGQQPGRVVRPDSPGGVTLGWARVLTGAENCGWCAMLASRGPVYDEDTVVTRGDGRRYHDHCDCAAVMVVKGRRWEGEDEYKRLRDLWDDAANRPTKEERETGQSKPLTRFDSRVKKLMQENPGQFAPVSLQEA